MKSLLDQAIRLSITAHTDQKDKAGEPYILHPLRLMLQCDSEEERLVAVLHDVMEDSHFSLENLKEEGFPKHVLDALLVLTHDKNDSYEDYLKKIKTNALAVKIKLLDLADNMNLSRLKSITDKDRERLEKYKSAHKFLKEP